MGKKYKNKDLAAKLGVSGTLVSLVLNNKADQHGIRKDTQEKVLTMAKQMGFFSSKDDNHSALPVEEKPGVIGLIVPSMNDPFIIGITPYLQIAFANLGLGFSIITKDPNDQRFERLTGAFRKFFSGLVLVGDAADEYTIRALRNSDYPFILLEKSVKTLRLNTVSSDLLYGSGLVAEHVARLGYKNIIIVSDRKSLKADKDTLNELENMLEQKASINKSVILGIDLKVTQDVINFSDLEKLLRPPLRADAIITLHASLVYPLMSFFIKRKIRVPQDVAVISMEDGKGFDLMFSPVTCLQKPLQTMAAKVAHMIWSEVKNSGKSRFKRQVNINPELIVRNSCGTLKN